MIRVEEEKSEEHRAKCQNQRGMCCRQYKLPVMNSHCKRKPSKCNHLLGGWYPFYVQYKVSVHDQNERHVTTVFMIVIKYSKKKPYHFSF